MTQGPSVGFRLYDAGVVEDAALEFDYERGLSADPAYRDRVARNTAYHRDVFARRGKRGLYTNWIQFVTHTGYDERGGWLPLPGEKAVFMNPMTDPEHIDVFLRHLHAD